MTKLRLSIIVPTRNRPTAISKLLRDLADQTLPASQFEVVVVDDGSVPAVDLKLEMEELPFAIRLIRRDSNPGAHLSRTKGAKAARGERMLHLDDDIELTPNVLELHAGVDGDFAVGPILYHPENKQTPYVRYQSKMYQRCAEWFLNGPNRLSAEHIYICNSSGPTSEFADVLEAVSGKMAGVSVPGEGFDECLIDIEMKDRNHFLQVLDQALVYHIDTKTLAEARQGHWLSGMTACRLLLDTPELRSELNFYMPIVEIVSGKDNIRRWMKVRSVWVAPFLVRLLSDSLTFTADHLPHRFVPARICYFPIAVAFWQGVWSVDPSFKRLRARLAAGAA
ncbi:glycosyltransferase involved in cell wall biosynthesis [Erythromicrobium ramosum]|uniref:Glycosyltransferase n=1 Tax=Erythrobacter ramosus TaxID=35811 RepID=A0A6I4UNI9_9SPHN|nr:glycosyltransferase family A protein [Erythrobacter ramosus]MBB3777200.1 glycosyltransferase involved in cell wall biosynthesis [Erythrobacter ramosus]MXP39966.1 glycosyltransferase [Erythrobacter ramosus]